MPESYASDGQSPPPHPPLPKGGSYEALPLAKGAARRDGVRDPNANRSTDSMVNLAPSETHPSWCYRNFLPFLILLVIVEFLWLRWFLTEPLPNAGNVGGNVQRSLFLWRALPGVVPGVRFDQCYLGMALGELSHVEFLTQRVPIVLAACLIGGAATALGLFVLRVIGFGQTSVPDEVNEVPARIPLEWWERLPLAFGLGVSFLGVITLLVGRMGWLNPVSTRAGLGALIVLAIAHSVWTRSRDQSTRQRQASAKPARAGLRWVSFALVTAPFLLVIALGSMLPTIDFDSIEYHLQGPREYFQKGRIALLPHNVYTSMPFGIEMLHLLGMEVIGNDWQGALTGQLLIAAFAPATAAMVAMTARRLASPRAAWMAAVVYLTTPWVYRLGVIPYVEGPLCYYHAALVWTVARLWSPQGEPIPASHRSRLWLLAGLFAGGAMACKYPGLISAVLPFGAIALIESFRKRSARIVLAYALGWSVVMGPWLAKNVVDTGNPVYPLAYRVFGGQYWNSKLDTKWNHEHGPKPVRLDFFVDSLSDVVGRSDWQSPLYLALAPLALCRPGTRRWAIALWAYGIYLFFSWWFLTHRVDRFWLPLLPTFAVLAGIGADWVRHNAWTVLLALLMSLSILTNFVYDSTALAGLNEWTADLNVLRKSVPAMLNAPLVRLDAELPPDAKVLLVGQAAVFHFQHPIVYNTVFNEETIETLTRGRSPTEIRESLRRLGVTHVYVDWFEIERYRSPGNYGFTDYVQPELFDKLIEAGVLETPSMLGARQQLFRVK